MPAPWVGVQLERVRMGPWALAPMARSILMEPGIAGYTGQGHGGEGWAGDSSGEGGPSAELSAADDLTPR